MKATNRGFTLIELMITVGVIAILAALAYPSYADYVIRGKIPEATSALADARVKMEQMMSDNRQYLVPVPGVTPPPPPTLNPCTAGGTPPNTTWIAQFNQRDFTLTCNSTPTTYTLTATGINSMAGFIYTINQANARQTTSLGGHWTHTLPVTCWVLRRDGSC